MLKKFFKKSGIEFVASFPKDDFVGMTIFRDKLIVATKSGVYQLNKHNKLEKIKFESGASNER